MCFKKIIKIIFALLFIAVSVDSFATINHFSETPTEVEGQILASSFFDDSFFLIGRVSVTDGAKTNKTLNENTFGSEYQPQVGVNTEGSTDVVYSWEITNPSACTLNADGSRSIKRDIVCKSYNPATKATETSSSSNCVAAQRPKDAVYCLAADEIYQWKVLNTSPCTSKCGTGTVQRSRECINTNLTTGLRRTAPEHECEMFGLTTPPIEYACTELTGCAKGWSYSNWSICQGSCGTDGVQTREARCLNNSGSELDASECESISGLAITTKACVPECAAWSYGEWSTCSASCFQTGIKTREALCKNVSGEVVADEFCPGVREILPTSESCIAACSGTTCADLLAQYPDLPNGTYTLTGPGGNFTATCDMTGGGWTLVPTLAGLSNFDGITQLKGYTEEQANRLYTLVKGGQSAYVGYSVGWNPGQDNAANPTWTKDVSVAAIVAFSKNNNINVKIQSYISAWSYATDADTGNIDITTYNTAGVSTFHWASGYVNWPSTWGQPTYLKTYADAIAQDMKFIRYKFSCKRVAGSNCSAEANSYTQVNIDLPKTNFYIK